jgi:rubredoxin/uncharacterized membrane protein
MNHRSFLNDKGFQMTKWKCSVCGYNHAGEDPPEQCPVCGAEKTKFDRPSDSGTHKKDTAGSAKSVSSNLREGEMKQWKCLVCGYIHTGPEPPDKCPVCGADKSQFEAVEVESSQVEESDSNAYSGKKRDPSAVHAQATLSGTGRFAFQLSTRMAFISRLHGHPIAVHIPNGVLPLSVLFTLLATVFNNEAFAVAAAYNMAFVCLSIPIVLITGLIDWNNRFNAHWTNIFSIKLICGIVVGVLSLIITLMWFTQPSVYMDWSPRLLVFLLLNLVNFAAAATAGFYGGKLVFKE